MLRSGEEWGSKRSCCTLKLNAPLVPEGELQQLVKCSSCRRQGVGLDHPLSGLHSSTMEFNKVKLGMERVAAEWEWVHSGVGLSAHAQCLAL